MHRAAIAAASFRSVTRARSTAAACVFNQYPSSSFTKQQQQQQQVCWMSTTAC